MSAFINAKDVQLRAYEKARNELLGIFDVGATADQFLAAIKSE
jgi:hypothetical protein